MKFKFNNKLRNYHPKKGIKKRTPLVWVFILIIIFSQVGFSLTFITSGSKISELEKVERILKEENKDIEYEIVKYTSLTSVSDKADDLGFQPPQKTLYVEGSSTLAKLP